jgi:hypothetical protein
MKNRTDSKYFPFPLLLLVAILLLKFTTSCLEESLGRPVPKRVIPEKDFALILKDLYLTDGLLTVPTIRDEFPEKDSIAAYNDIITNHGYTKDAMDLTLEYYFVKKPKRLIKIYDRILGELTETDIRLSNLPVDLSSPDNNQWNGLSSYTFPDPSGSINPEFSLPINSQGYFTLSFTVTIFPFDQTANPQFIAWLCSADSSETGKKYFLPPIKYIKDGYPHVYTLSETNKRNTPVIFKGNLYESENNPDLGERYGSIKNILFVFTGGL